MQWQFYPSLGLSYSKEWDEDCQVFYNWLIIGCFQFKWYSAKK